MLTLSIVFALLTLSIYGFRRYVRRVFYVLRTGDRHPDWKALHERWYGADNEEKDAR